MQLIKLQSVINCEGLLTKRIGEYDWTPAPSNVIFCTMTSSTSKLPRDKRASDVVRRSVTGQSARPSTRLEPEYAWILASNSITSFALALAMASSNSSRVDTGPRVGSVAPTSSINVPFSSAGFSSQSGVLSLTAVSAAKAGRVKSITMTATNKAVKRWFLWGCLFCDPRLQFVVLMFVPPVLFHPQFTGEY